MDCSLFHFVLQFKYPDTCLEFKYDPTFPIRGLYYDKSKGCLMKLDFFGSIELDGCYYGRRKVKFKKLPIMFVLIFPWSFSGIPYLCSHLFH